MSQPSSSVVMLAVPGRVDRVAADEARVARLRERGALAAVVRPAPRRAWWADEDHQPPEPDPGGLVWCRRVPLRRRRARLAASVAAAADRARGRGRPGGPEGSPHGGGLAVYAAGHAAWSEAAALATALGTGVLLGAREESAVKAARRLVRVLDPTRCLLIAETETLAGRLRRATDNLLVVEVVGPCVPERERVCRRSEPGSPLQLAVALDGEAEGIAVLLAGLGTLRTQRPDVEIQLLLVGDDRALDLANQAAAAAGMLSCVSTTRGVRPGLADSDGGMPLDDVLAGVDAVARPWVAAIEEPPFGLEAAARAIPVLAPPGPADAAPGVARELAEPGAPGWATALRWLVDEPAAAAEAAEAAQRRVREHCRVEASDGALLHLAGLVAST